MKLRTGWIRSVLGGRCVPLLALALSALGTFVLIGISPHHAIAAPSLVAVTPLDGINSIIGPALSADGSTVVGSRPRQDQTTFQIDERAFYWTRNDGFRLFDELDPTAPRQPTFRPRDVSGDGSRVVGSLGQGTQPVLWEGGTLTPLSLLAGGTSGGTAFAISDNGLHIGGSLHDGGTVTRVSQNPAGGVVVREDPRRVPVVWNVDDGAAMGLSEASGAVLDVSNDGIAVGNFDLSEFAPGATVGFRWEAGRGLQIVPSGNPYDTLGSPTAAGISSDGTTIVGRTSGPPAPGFTVSVSNRGYHWSGEAGSGSFLPIEGISLLESLPIPLPFLVDAMATSADGSTIVGGYRPSDVITTSPRPFVWTQSGGFQDLGILLQALGISTAGWSLSSAVDVSADGTTIVGTGVYRNELGRSSNVAWIAVIPEPATAVMVGLGLFALSIRRDRQRVRTDASRSID